MITFTRMACLFGGVALLAAPAAAQDLVALQNPTADGGAKRQPPPVTRMRPPGVWTQETFQRTVELGPRRTFELSNMVGEIRVTGGEGNTVRIVAVKKVQDPNREAARALLQNVMIRVSERGGGVEVLTEQPAGRTAPILVDYEITLPAEASVQLRSFGGGTRVSNVKGEVRAEAYAGNITLTSVGRVSQAKAYVGGVFITGAEGDYVTADTLGGPIQFRNVRARTVELRTVSGAITASDVDCERCTMSSTIGDIELSGPLSRNARYTVNSNSGNIRLLTDGSVGFDIEAISGSALKMEYTLKPSGAPSVPARGTILRGSYGDGSAIITLRSFTGNVSVLRLPAR